MNYSDPTGLSPAGNPVAALNAQYGGFSGNKVAKYTPPPTAAAAIKPFSYNTATGKIGGAPKSVNDFNAFGSASYLTGGTNTSLNGGIASSQQNSSPYLSRVPATDRSGNKYDVVMTPGGQRQVTSPGGNFPLSYMAIAHTSIKEPAQVYYAAPEANRLAEPSTVTLAKAGANTLLAASVLRSTSVVPPTVARPATSSETLYVGAESRPIISQYDTGAPYANYRPVEPGPAPASRNLDIVNPRFVPNTQRMLQNVTNQVVSEIRANPGVVRKALSPQQYRILSKGGKTADATFGTAVEKIVATKISGDPGLNSIFRSTGTLRGSNGRFISSPDFVGYEGYNLRLLDITTEAQRAEKFRRFGNSVDVITQPGRSAINFR